MSTPAKHLAGTLGLRSRWRDRLLPWALIAPTAVFVIAVAIVPLAYSVVTSLQEYRLGQPPVFVGLRNYQHLLVDENFRGSLLTTLVFTIAATGVEFVLGLALALLLKEEFSFQGIIRSSLIVPMVIAPVVVGIIWRLLYNADVGLFSFAAQALTGHSVSVLSSTTMALPALILVVVWEWTPF